MEMNETDGIYYFNRCRRCSGLITKIQILKAFKGTGEPCPCGSSMFGPTNPIGLEWVSPKVLQMIVWQMLGWLPPAPEPTVAPPVPDAAKFKRVFPLSKDEIRLPEEGE
jgi:hypothetical protein